jgi:hypothetical protein
MRDTGLAFLSVLKNSSADQAVDKRETFLVASKARKFRPFWVESLEWSHGENCRVSRSFCCFCSVVVLVLFFVEAYGLVSSRVHYQLSRLLNRMIDLFLSRYKHYRVSLREFRVRVDSPSVTLLCLLFTFTRLSGRKRESL